MSAPDTSRIILPEDPSPLSYHIELEPHFTTFTYDARTAICVKAIGTVKEITLNCAALEIHAVRFQTSSTDPTTDVNFTADAASETLTLQLPRPFTGEGIVTFEYSGRIRDDLFGFYRARYTDPGTGNDAYILTTQFCPVDARKTFPCWDEPARKARFSASIYAPDGIDVLFNVPHSDRHRVTTGVRGHAASASLVRWDFPSTPPMSTYLLAWAVGCFEYIERVVPKTHRADKHPNDPAARLPSLAEDPNRYSNEETVVRVVASPGKSLQGQFALDIACKSLAWYEQTFQCNYPLPKLDLLAAPDFAFGGMENFGLVLLRETAVLTDAVPTANRKATIATVVAHEVSHMWFGDMISMEWWKELWLNESFATYVTNVALHTIHPEWNLRSQFVYEEGSRAFTLDALRSSHPIESEIRSAKQLDDVFDAISYAKGGSILRMVLDFVGQETFFAGICLYIERHRYANATTEDLWRALGEASGVDLLSMMKNWTGRQGFPYITVSEAGDGAVTLTQHRFLARNDVRPEEDSTIWQVPLTNEFGHPNALAKTILTERSATINGATVRAVVPAYVKVNVNRSAFCRVLYSEGLLQSLLTHVPQFPNLDRFALLSDYAAFARGGYCTTTRAVDVLSAYAGEEDFTVLCECFEFTRSLRAILSPIGDEAVDALNAFSRQLYAHVARKLGYQKRPDDSFLEGRLRAEVFAHMVAAHDQEALAAAREFAEGSEVNDASQARVIPGDQRTTVFALYAEEQGEEAFNVLTRLATTASDPMDRANYLAGLKGTTVERAVPRLFDFALTDAVRTQDLLHLFGPLAANPRHTTAFINELIARWPAVAAKAPGVMQTRIANLTKHGAEPAAVAALRAFYEDLPEGTRASIGGSLRQAIESVELNVAWVERDGRATADHLRDLISRPHA